jgi:hypothetical protein
MVNRFAGAPNAVYERTHAGLVGLVPGRAARRVLDTALVRLRSTPDAIGAAEMAEALLGPVFHELAAVLPRDGLRREIKRLARVIRSMAPEPPTGDEFVAATAGSAGASHAPEPTAPTTTPTPAAAPTMASVDAPTADATAVRRRLADTDRVLVALALLDGVDGAAVFEPAGRVVSVRGDLPDAAALGRVIAASGDLLGRHGAIRSVCVATAEGVLVALPVGPRWLAVGGAPDINLGAVYAALSALEEER